jgi:hypothetical protein
MSPRRRVLRRRKDGCLSDQVKSKHENILILYTIIYWAWLIAAAGIIGLL